MAHLHKKIKIINSAPNSVPNSIPNSIPNSVPNSIPSSVPNACLYVMYLFSFPCQQ